MKLFVVALLLAVSYGEALQCLDCNAGSHPSGKCVESVVTCQNKKDACVTAYGPKEQLLYKRCMKKFVCEKLNRGQGVRRTCCYTDNCNQNRDRNLNALRYQPLHVE